MREQWSATTLGDVLTFQRGFDITRKTQTDGSVPVVSSGGISSYHDTAAVEGPGVVIGRKGTLGKVFFLEDGYWPHDTTLWVKDFKENWPRFVYYFMTQLDTSWLDAGSANPTLNRNHLHPLKVLWPPVADQRAIADVLGALDDKIAANRKLAETSDQLALAQFRQVQREFGSAGTLRDLLDLSYGKSLPATKRLGGDIPVIGSGGIAGYHNEALVGGPAVVVGRKGSIGTVHWSATPAFPIDTTFYVVPKSDTTLVYSYYLLRSLDWSEYNSDSAVPGLNRNEALARRVRLVDDTRISQFGAKAAKLLQVQDQAKVESNVLANLRGTLLPRLMSGELRVRDAEQIVGGAI